MLNNIGCDQGKKDSRKFIFHVCKFWRGEKKKTKLTANAALIMRARKLRLLQKKVNNPLKSKGRRKYFIVFMDI